MRRFLLALPLFLVVGLAFVDLPNGNSAENNISNQNIAPSPIASPTPSTNSPLPTTIGPSSPSKNQFGEERHKRRPPHNNEGFEEHEDGDDDEFEEDDD